MSLEPNGISSFETYYSELSAMDISFFIITGLYSLYFNYEYRFGNFFETFELPRLIIIGFFLIIFTRVLLNLLDYVELESSSDERYYYLMRDIKTKAHDIRDEIELENIWFYLLGVSVYSWYVVFTTVSKAFIIIMLPQLGIYTIYSSCSVFKAFKDCFQNLLFSLRYILSTSLYSSLKKLLRNPKW